MNRVMVREGAETDLSIFTALVEETARRQSFSPYPSSYYEQTWRAFAAGGQVQLFMAEHEGVVLASNLVIGLLEVGSPIPTPHQLMLGPPRW